MNGRREVLEALENWIIHITAKKEKATPEEIEALPKVAKVYLGHYLYSNHYLTKREWK